MNTRINLIMSLLAAALTATATAGVNRTSVHDPSVVIDTITAPTAETFYVFGSHMGVSRSTDLLNWTSNIAGGESKLGTLYGRRDTLTGKIKTCSYEYAYLKHEVTRVRVSATDSVDFGNFNAAAWNTAVNNYTVLGNQWAPDVTYNPVMKKWLYYVSLNGAKWNSVIVCMAADQITGPYVYQGPVVFSGFNGAEGNPSYKDCDLEIVLGQLDSLPDRYNRGELWGSYWPHAIDPCVYTDADGNFWLAYGSWSGGIYSLKLDPNTGLRDYTVSYEAKNNTTENVTSDPYFGKKLAGGYYVSGEGPYITRMGDYYYLFLSYGFYSPDGGYEMRLFRSKNPDGPFVDPQGVSAIYYSWQKNYGTDAGTDRGLKLMGGYRWPCMSVAEVAQGHNSAATDREGRSFVVYHTKFNNGTAGHAVRVHQLLLNEVGWPCVAPYEFKGETATSESVATTQIVAEGDMPGVFSLLGHPYRVDYEHYAYSTEAKISLENDGTVTGDYTGTWSLTPGTSYITLTLGGYTYRGVVLEQREDYTDVSSICFTAVSAQNNANKSPLGRTIWGAARVSVPAGDCYTGLRAYYDFDHTLTNLLDATQQGEALAEANGTVPTFADSLRGESTALHQYFGYPSATSSSYVRFPNALQGVDLTERGATVSMFVRRVDSNDWDALWSFLDEDTSDGISGRLYMTANNYLGFNGTGGWFDANHPSAQVLSDLETAMWHLLTLTFTAEGWTLYLDGEVRYTQSTAASFNKSDDFTDYASVLRLISSAANFYLGYGSWWGSAPIYVDDLALYDRALTLGDVQALYINQLTDAFDPDAATSAIETIRPDVAPATSKTSATYDLQGRRVTRPARGLYIVNGKVMMVR